MDLDRAILLVDDECGMRGVCKLTLERAGFSVFEADSFDSARRVWCSNAGKIGALVTDYALGGPTGLDLSKSLRREAPALPVLIISGHHREDVGAPESMRFLQKPFSPPMLAQAVQQCLQA